MKTYKRQKLNLLATLTALAFASPLAAEEDKHKGHKDHGDHSGHDHDHGHDHADEKKAGPNGGRILTEIEPHAELFITEDRLVKITILNEEGETVPVGEQMFKAIGGERKAPTIMEFTEEDGILISSAKLPEGMNVPFILTYQATPDGEKKTLRLALNLADCPGCEYLEYACTCDHEH